VSNRFALSTQLYSLYHVRDLLRTLLLTYHVLSETFIGQHEAVYANHNPICSNILGMTYLYRSFRDDESEQLIW
jgi:hypothetical protein